MHHRTVQHVQTRWAWRITSLTSLVSYVIVALGCPISVEANGLCGRFGGVRSCTCQVLTPHTACCCSAPVRSCSKSAATSCCSHRRTSATRCSTRVEAAKMQGDNRQSRHSSAVSTSPSDCHCPSTMWVYNGSVLPPSHSLVWNPLQTPSDWFLEPTIQASSLSSIPPDPPPRIATVPA